MTKIYVITYDFYRPMDCYLSLFRELTLFPKWWHFLADTWLVATDLDAKGILEKLRPHIDDESNLLIVEAGEDFAGWLPKKAWDWIRLHRSRATSKAPLGTSA